VLPILNQEFGDIVSYSILGTRIVVFNNYEVIHEALIGEADAFSGKAQFPLTKYLINGLGMLSKIVEMNLTF